MRLHWTALIGGLFFSGFRFAPGAWLGFVLVILIHELGHAFVVRATRQRVLGVDIHGLGGECHWSGSATPIQRAAIAWGGVWGQMVLFAAAVPLSVAAGDALGAFGRDLFYALTWTSLWLAAINLLPVRPLDGAEAWQLPKLLAQKWRRRRRAPAHRAPPKKGSGWFTKKTRVKDEPAPPIPDEVRRVLAKIADDAREARRPKS